MPRQLPSTAALLVLAAPLVATLAACGTSRFEGARAARLPAQEPLVAAPAGRVTSEPLAPLPGTPLSGAPLPGTVAAADPALGTGPVAAAVPPPVVAEPVLAPPPAPVVATGRASVVGGWNAADAGGDCRVSLSSAPALDLYRASTTGCANKDLARVSAWDFRDGEVYLYQPGGTVAARLRQAGGSLDGALSKSGAALTLTR